MSKGQYYRILHISDLHFSKTGHAQEFNTKALGNAEIQSKLIATKDGTFLRDIEAFVNRQVKEKGNDSRPKAIIVSGDLVNEGHEDEFVCAVQFLRDLCKCLGIPYKHVFVVPGNHDVRRTNDNKTVSERFANYQKAVSDFSSPIIANDEPHFLRIEDLVAKTEYKQTYPKIYVELFLLISPTRGGVEDPVLSQVIDGFAKDIPKSAERLGFTGDTTKLADELRGLLNAQLANVKADVDIALVGTQQLREIRDSSLNDDDDIRPIRIAVLHHHLIPDSGGPEVKEYEHMVDAGQLLEALLERSFDLVLTGHKHHKRLIYLYEREHGLHNVCSSSLFVGAPTGFNFIDIYGNDSPFFARVQMHESDPRSGHFPDSDLGRSEDLIRRSRIRLEVMLMCAEVDRFHQQEYLEPILKSVSKIQRWSRQRSDAGVLVKREWKHYLDRFEHFANEMLRFNPPAYEQWDALIETAYNNNVKRMCVVSVNDVDYWIDGYESKGHGLKGYAFYYSRALRDFAGEKTRILIVRSDWLNESEKKEKLKEVVEAMQKDDFEVLLAHFDNVDKDLREDFGLLEDFAMWQFSAMDSYFRYLEMHFNKQLINDYSEKWGRLRRLSRDPEKFLNR